MKSIPIRWFEDTTKPLVDVDPSPNVEEMVEELSIEFGFTQD